MPDCSTWTQFRHGIEKMDPAEYLLSNYYEHWMHTIEHYAEVAGILDPADLEKRTQYYLENPDAPLPERETDTEIVEFVDWAVTNGFPPTASPTRRPGSPSATRSSSGTRARTDTPAALATSAATGA